MAENLPDEAITGQQLLEWLTNLPEEDRARPIGGVGHYGEFLPMMDMPYTSESRIHWDTKAKMKVIALWLPDRGPEPD